MSDIIQDVLHYAELLGNYPRLMQGLGVIFHPDTPILKSTTYTDTDTFRPIFIDLNGNLGNESVFLTPEEPETNTWSGDEPGLLTKRALTLAGTDGTNTAIVALNTVVVNKSVEHGGKDTRSYKGNIRSAWQIYMSTKEKSLVDDNFPHEPTLEVVTTTFSIDSIGNAILYKILYRKGKLQTGVAVFESRADNPDLDKLVSATAQILLPKVINIE